MLRHNTALTTQNLRNTFAYPTHTFTCTMANQPSYVLLPMRSWDMRRIPVADIGCTFTPSLIPELAYRVHLFTNLLENDSTAYVTDEPKLRYLHLQTTHLDVMICV